MLYRFKAPMCLICNEYSTFFQQVQPLNLPKEQKLPFCNFCVCFIGADFFALHGKAPGFGAGGLGDTIGF